MTQAAALSLRDGSLKPPKTAAGKRQIDLLPRAKQALRNQKCYSWVMKEHVFRQVGSSNPIRTYKQVNHYWTLLLEAAGVRYRPFKQTRHTYITHMLGSGYNPLYVADQSGHANTQMQGVYAKWIEELDDQEYGRAAK